MDETKIGELAKEIEKIAEIERCLGCQCFYDTLLEFKEFLEKEGGDQDIKERLSRVMEKVRSTHGCLGCDPCLPVPIANAIYEMGGRTGACSCESGERVVSLPSFPSPPQEKTSLLWPIEPGEYLAGNQAAPVAISTLASDGLAARIAQALGKDGYALVGKTHTENIGIEKIIKNTITNPHIRFLILCGKDTKGHWAGQTLLSLFKDGINQGKRIIGSQGQRPVLINLSFEEVRHFREQVEIVDLVNVEEPTRIEAEVKACLKRSPGKYEKSLDVRKAPAVEAHRPARLALDPSGFFIIYPKKDEGRIYLEHYKADGTLNEIIQGADPMSIASTAIERGLVSRLDHAAYLGKELGKASLSLGHGFQYVQDSASGKAEIQEIICLSRD